LSIGESGQGDAKLKLDYPSKDELLGGGEGSGSPEGRGGGAGTTIK